MTVPRLIPPPRDATLCVQLHALIREQCQAERGWPIVRRCFRSGCLGLPPVPLPLFVEMLQGERLFGIGRSSPQDQFPCQPALFAGIRRFPRDLLRNELTLAMGKTPVEQCERLWCHGAGVSLAAGQCRIGKIEGGHEWIEQASLAEQIQAAPILFRLRTGLPGRTLARKALQGFGIDRAFEAFTTHPQVEFAGGEQHGVAQRFRIQPPPLSVPPQSVARINSAVLSGQQRGSSSGDTLRT